MAGINIGDVLGSFGERKARLNYSSILERYASEIIPARVTVKNGESRVVDSKVMAFYRASGGNKEEEPHNFETSIFKEFLKYMNRNYGFTQGFMRLIGEREISYEEGFGAMVKQYSIENPLTREDLPGFHVVTLVGKHDANFYKLAVILPVYQEGLDNLMEFYEHLKQYDKGGERDKERMARLVQHFIPKEETVAVAVPTTGAQLQTRSINYRVEESRDRQPNGPADGVDKIPNKGPSTEDDDYTIIKDINSTPGALDKGLVKTPTGGRSIFDIIYDPSQA